MSRIEEPLRDTSWGAWALRVFLSVAFLMTGLLHVTGVLKTGEAFGAVGGPQVAHVILGLVQIAAAILLVVPGAALAGAGLLALTMLVLIVVRHLSGDTWMEALSVFWLFFVALVGAEAARPHPWRPGRPFFWQIPARRLPGSGLEVGDRGDTRV
jgi:uncharacterized membrane protein YphA (DoxX/SURF4 family)